MRLITLKISKGWQYCSVCIIVMIDIDHIYDGWRLSPSPVI